jgi:hypothetical protein
MNTDPDASDPGPWERWGTARRDCARHRGHVLLLPALAAWVLGVSSFCLVVTGLAAAPWPGPSRGSPSATWSG